MHQTVKILTITATLAVSCSLLYANTGKIDTSYKLKSQVEQVKFDLPDVAPVSHLYLPRELKALEKPVIPAKPSAKPAVFMSNPGGLKISVERISFNTPSLAPMAFVRFCRQYPLECEVRRMAFRPRPVALTEERRAELAKVNRGVNRAIRPQANVSGVTAEEWLISPRSGDCNDYAVTKRHELLTHGWPSRALVLAEVVIPSGEHHLVLVVRTREVDLVLDNLNWNVRPVSQIRYQWVRAQQSSNPKFWSTISVSNAAPGDLATR